MKAVDNKPGIGEKEFLEIFDLWYKPLKNYIYYKSGDIDMADDVVQDVFMKVWEKRKEVKLNTVKSLLYTIANNFCKNRYDHKRVVLQFANNFKEQVVSSSPEFELELKEFDKELQGAISNLNEKSRVVFLMNRIDNYTYAQIAKNLGISVKAVEKRMKKALDSLKKEIKFKF